MATIRELTARFGIEVDTTPIKRWNSAINEAKKNLSSLGSVKFSGVGLSLKNALKKSAAGFDSDDVKGEYKNKIDKFQKFLKRSLLVVAGTVAAGLAGAFKSFQKFGEEEQATSRLRFQLSKIPGEFEKTQKTISETIKATGGLISKVDLLNSASAAFEIDTNPEAFRETIDSASKLSLILGRDLSEVVSAFSSFRATGATDAFKAFGFFTAQQLEVLQKAGSEVSQVGISQRTNLLSSKVSENLGFVNDEFSKFVETGIASSKREETARAELIKVIGKQSDIIKGLNDASTNFTVKLAENIQKTDGVLSGLKKTIDAISEESIKRAFEQRKTREEKIKSGNGEFFNPFTAAFDFLTGGGTTNNSTTINSPVNITVNGAISPTETAREIKKQMDSIMGQTYQQSKQNTIIRGKNQVPE